jgi:hypothetical protein
MTKKVNLLLTSKSIFASGLVVLSSATHCLHYCNICSKNLCFQVISVIGGIVVGYLSSTSIRSVSGPARLTTVYLPLCNSWSAFDVFFCLQQFGSS